jgi:hypothetical protein
VSCEVGVSVHSTFSVRSSELVPNLIHVENYTCRELSRTNYHSQTEFYLTTDGQSASLSWYQATCWDPRPIFLSLLWKYFRKFSVLFLRGALSDERTVLYIMCTIATGHSSAVTVRSMSCRIRYHILVSNLRLGSLSVASYDSQGYGGGILARLHMGGNTYL